MADEIRRLDYYSANVPDKVGEGARVLGMMRVPASWLERQDARIRDRAA